MITTLRDVWHDTDIGKMYREHMDGDNNLSFTEFVKLLDDNIVNVYHDTSWCIDFKDEISKTFFILKYS